MASPTIPVSFFNANILDVTVQVNNGPQFTVAAAAPPNFTPNLPTANAPTFDPVGPPRPGVLAPGSNFITITTSGSVEPFIFPVNLGGSVQYASVQFYAFWNSNKAVNWVILNNGSYVDGSLSLGKPTQLMK